MSYSDDFASADMAGAPLDPTIMVGADPLFWGGVLLALLVAAMIGWLIGGSARSKRVDAAASIWEAIDDVAKTAMKADTEALPARASELQRVLRARLGRTLDFGGELTGCARALDKALKGEVEDRSARAVAAPAPAGDPAAPNREAGSSSAAASVTIVSVHPQAASDSAPARSGKRSMTNKERNDALRLAVADFNDYWRHRSAREGDMRAVVTELCTPAPRRPRLSHSGGH